MFSEIVICHMGISVVSLLDQGRLYPVAQVNNLEFVVDASKFDKGPVQAW